MEVIIKTSSHSSLNGSSIPRQKGFVKAVCDFLCKVFVVPFEPLDYNKKKEMKRDVMNMAQAKTNAMRMLEKAKINYGFHEYDHDDGAIDGVSVAAKLGQDPARVFKTLVTQGASKNFYVFVIPVAEELDLKKAAKSVGEKNVSMLHVADLLKTTGYIRGGCSPIGMKKQFGTVIDSTAQQYETIMVSAGRIGAQVELAPDDLVKVTGARFESITFA